MPSVSDNTARVSPAIPQQDAIVSTPDEALKLALETDFDALMSDASRLREQAFGNQITLCAIINAKSGNCTMDCRFCSQSRDATTPIDTFAFLDLATLKDRIRRLLATPVSKIGIVTSGAALNGPEFDALIQLLDSFDPAEQARLCASLGRLPEDDLVRLRNAGLSRYHHNLESGPSFYPSVCTTQTWESRRRTVMRGLGTGLSVCSGGLFGMGETWQERIELAFTLRDMGVDNVPINFLTPHPGTALGSLTPLDAREALRIIAVFRHILPQATLRVCGGRTATLGSMEKDLFFAGANALMTGDYLTTKGSALDNDLRMIADLGLEVEI